MATVVNFIDTTLQAAASRTVNLPTAQILLTPSAPAFHVAVDGTITPESITFTATQIDLDAPITFNAAGGTLTGVTAKTATLAGANMPGTSVTVIASATANGVTYTGPCTISKVRDADGGQGPQGPRGAGHFYVIGGSWSDVAAEMATPGGSVIDDVVTISDGVSFTSEKRWNGTTWVAVGTVIPGSLLVENSVTATKIDTRGLAVRDLQGNIILGAGSALPAEYAAPGTRNSELAPALQAAASRGAALNDDPALENPDAWVIGEGVFLSPGPSPSPGAVGKALFDVAPGQGVNAQVYTRKRFAIDSSRVYRLSANLYAAPDNNREMYLFIDLYDADGNAIAQNGWGGGHFGYAFGGLPPVGWARQGADIGPGTGRAIPGEARTATIGIWFQYSGSGSGSVEQAAQDIRIEDVTAVTTAQAVATAAKAAADAANNAIANISSDNVLSKGEKPEVIRQFDAMNAEFQGLVDQAVSLGIGYGDYYSAKAALNTYLNSIPSWSYTNIDTTINAADFRAAFNGYYTAKQALLNAFAARAKALADAAAGAANTAQGTADVAAQAAANAQAAADSANNAIANISSDSVLSKGEKPEVIRQFDAMNAEFQGLVDQAVSLGVDYNSYYSSKVALNTYLNSIPSWNYTNIDTTINPADFRAAFNGYYTAKQALLNAIAARAASTAAWANTYGPGKPENNATVGATIGQNLFGQMTAANISSYIAAAAIKLALIDKASIGSLEALSGVIGLLRTSASGERTEIADNVIKMFASNNQKILHLGDSTK